TRNVGASGRYCAPARVRQSLKKAAEPASNVEENRLAVALDADIETIDRQIAPHLLVGNERPTPVLRHQRQDGIAVVGSLVGEIKPGVDLAQHTARKDTKNNMRRLRLAVWTRHRTRLDGVKTID